MSCKGMTRRGVVAGEGHGAGAVFGKASSSAPLRNRGTHEQVGRRRTVRHGENDIGGCGGADIYLACNRRRVGAWRCHTFE